MKTLVVPALATGLPEVAGLPELMDGARLAWQTIGCVNWPEFSYCPAVRFRVARTDRAILLHYHIVEDSVRAVARHDDERIWEDSCCEFFCQSAEGGIYYNIEVNCAGRMLIGAGASREGRTHAPQHVLDTVGRWSSLGMEPFDARLAHTEWELALVVPASAFFLGGVSFDGGTRLRANFYKCGDLLPTPHFLSWNPIAAPAPDFHRPDCFGELMLE
ncbi:carbohydrate-binding family 9-like protein [Hallella seregens]|uniref:Carbohydrate-binding family 9-like protein n=1 Tax=Hallella seregens ATCC 51272 TaxID=1336250 RepID=A0ABV5ZH52_9BACT|nr:carbohydrate-binding family 9-like protein [Hallella seregens]